MKQAYPIGGGVATLWLVDNGQGVRVLATSESESVHHKPVTLARRKREIDAVVRVLKALRDDLPDEVPGA